MYPIEGTVMNAVYKIPGYSESFSSIVRARHDVVNRRLKQFSVLRTTFRHSLSLHSYCFHAAANLTKLMIEHSDPVFDVHSFK